MSLKFNARSWHNWISVILVVPILIVAVTAVFIAHNRSLGLNEIDVSGAVGWLPGYGSAGMKEEHTEVRSSLTTADGRQWIGTLTGLYRMEGDGLVPVPELAGLQVRDLVVAPWGMVAATKGGIWVEQGGTWRMAYKGDAWSANLAADGAVLVAVKDKGLVTSRDGAEWKADPAIKQALSTMPAEAMTKERVTLGKLVMDMHTGKAFLGKKAEWVWIDIIGIVMTFLGITGVYLWWRGERRKREMA